MAADMLGKRTFPCEPATIDEISNTLWFATGGEYEQVAALRRCTCPIQPDQISWSAVRLLGFWGKKKNTCNTQAGMAPGFYISCRGDALILIHQDDAYIQQYVNRCDKDLEILQIHSTSLSSLNVSPLIKLRELYAEDNKVLRSLEGLEQLTQLTTLALSQCEKLTALPGLENLAQLTSLNLYLCSSLTSLPGLENLTQLTSLDLSQCSSLTPLPPLDNLTQLSQLNLSQCRSLTALPPLDNLTQLSQLNLSQCYYLAALPPLDNLTQLSQLNLSQCYYLTDLPSLDNLTQLTQLDLSKCSSLTALPSLDNLTQLTQLNLSGCERLTALPPLDNLKLLTQLSLSNCHNLSALPPLDNLKQLTQLNLSGCESLSALPSLDNLTQLTHLDLSWCSSLTALPSLDNLTQLTQLDLSECSRLTALPPLDNLTQLTQLNLSQCRSLTALPGPKNLSQLTSLDLSGCRSLTILSGLENLPQLTSLDLFGCLSLTALPSLDNLTQLTHLGLSGCLSLTALPSLNNLTQLTSLNLFECGSLTALPSLDNLTQLTSLILSGCGITALPECLRNLKSLRTLDLSFLELKELPDWLPEIAEKFTRDFNSHDGNEKAIVSLWGTTVEGVDMSIFEQPYEVVVKWFEEREKGRTQPLNEIKVVFLGDGEAGKSHTIARLMNDGGDPIDYTDKSTPGIVIKHRNYEVEDRKFRVHYWDFGGQEIMHSMHRIFLTNRTMYVVLLNARDDTQGDRAHYWLQNIQSFAPNAPVLLVLNKIDQNPKASVDERTLRNKYKGLTQVIRLSALDFDKERFNREFTDVLLKEICKCDCLDAQWPQSWIQVKNRLENMHTHYITGTAYKRICRECNVDKVQRELLHWFNDLGVSFCFCDPEDYSLNRHVILRPDWITNGLYIILFNECEGTQNGLIPHQSIHELLERASYDRSIRCTLPDAAYDQPGDIEYVLGVMRKFQLSLDAGDGREFIPMLCQQESTVDLHYYEADENTLEFHMEFEYLPDNLLHRLMVERHSDLDMTNVWRRGARFELPDTGISAVVVIDGETLKFFIRHSGSMHRPNTYLTMLKANVDRIVERMSIKAPRCSLIYKLDGKQDEFDYEMLKAMLEARQTLAFSMSQRCMIPIVDIFNQSAPDNLDDEKKLLDKIVQACGNLQDDPIYRLVPKSDGHGYVNGQGMEDLRNRRVRDNLINAGYRMNDQTQRGVSSSGKSVGELDMLVYNDSNEPWTIIEALRVSDQDKSEWNKHLKKLSDNYNTRGFPALYLLTYVDADTTTFKQIWESYQDHIKAHHPGQLKYSDGSFVELDVPNHQYIKVAKCRYSGGVDPITVYHIFARISTHNG